MDPRHAVLFEPIRIGPKTLPNRFCQVAHCTSFGVNRPLSQAHFRATKAEGGWGAVFTEECSVHPEADSMPMVLARIWDDDDVANLSLMCDMLHEHGTLAGIELWYGGVNPQNLESRAVSRAPSQIVSDLNVTAPCLEMDRDDIVLVQGFFVEAALRARDAGFDIICLYGGHEGLLEQFLSPHYNKRTDEYGGSFENRARFWRETIEKVRAVIDGDIALTVRISADTLRGPEGLELERDVLPFVRMCDDLVDAWDVHIGGGDWGDDATPSRFFAGGRQLEWIKRVKEATRKPVIGCGRFTDPDRMVQAISDGALDIIGAARPSIADPFIPHKIAEGRVDDIRECIGCNICVARFETGGPPIICTQNATAGEEYRRGWHPERFEPARDPEQAALVIGAGPAGLECARVLGERGIRHVHLVDEMAEPGGHLKWLTQLPGLGEWRRVVSYRATQLDKLRNVTFIPKTRLEAPEVLAYGADLVVIATGAHWSTNGLGPVTRNGLPGADATLPHILTPEQILADGKDVPGERVVIVDHDGYHVAPALADMLAARGKHVTVMTQLPSVSPYTHLTLEATFFGRKLHSNGVRVLTNVIPTQCGPEGVWAHSAYGSSSDAELYSADAVVLVTQRVSDTTLYRSLKDLDAAQLEDAGIQGLFRIGDCLAPRVIAEAVFDGHRLAREIDTDNPAMPMPYRRERLVVSRPTVSA